LVLSIDWEITDEVLINFLSQIKELKTTYKDDKIILTFLQILGSLGEYIKTNRGKAHPKTFKILNSVFSQFDDVILAKDMQESEKKRVLRTEMAKYKELRTQISREKADKIPKKAAKPEQKIKPKVKEQLLSAEVTNRKTCYRAQRRINRPWSERCFLFRRNRQSC
jgi:pilus assembly protein FimV